MATYALLKIGVPDPVEDHLEIGTVILKRRTIYFRDAEARTEFVERNKIKFIPPRYEGPEYDYFEADLETCLRALLPDAIVTAVRSGKWEGYGHGRETITARNRDGTLIYECTRIARCEGPGYSCSYDHGPWYEYGRVTGGAPLAETRLAEAVLMYFDGNFPSSELKQLALRVIEEVA